jgi:N-acetylmuramoyl-L-alanine amidase
MSIKVWLDAGHGGSDPGAEANRLIEKQMTLITALQTKLVLTAHGVIVGMSRITDIYLSIEERYALANKFGADYAISIHYNAGGGDGEEIIHSIYKGKGELLSKAIEAAIKNQTGQNSRGCYGKAGKNGDYYGFIRGTNMPAIIVEGAFIDSKDYVIVDTVAEQQLMGTAIAVGILKHIGIPYTPMATPTQPTGTIVHDYGTAVVTADSLNVRKTPNTIYAPIGTLTMGTKVRIASVTGSWANIYFGNQGGYVNTAFLTSIIKL